jgi:hypothetical protein
MNDLMRTVAASRPARLDEDSRPDPGPIMAHPRHQQRVRRRLVLVAAVPAVVAVAVAGALIVQSNTEQPRPLASPNASPGTAAQPRPKPTTAREVLLVAAEQSAQGAPRGKYWRTVIEQGERLGTSATMRKATLDRWSPTDPGAATVLVVTVNGVRGVKKAVIGEGLMLGGTAITAEQLETLPTDPAALRGWLLERFQRGGAGETTGWRLFVAAQALVTDLPVSPAVRSAAYRMLADVPGGRLIGEVKDQRGRPGVAIGYQRNGSEARLIVDAGQGRALADESWHGGTLLSYRVIVEAGYTDENPPS